MSKWVLWALGAVVVTPFLYFQMWLGQGAVASAGHIEASDDIKGMAAATSAKIDAFEAAEKQRVRDFMDEGPRFTGEDGEKLTLRVATLETDASWGAKMQAAALAQLTEEVGRVGDRSDEQIERLKRQVDRLELANDMHHDPGGSP